MNLAPIVTTSSVIVPRLLRVCFVVHSAGSEADVTLTLTENASSVIRALSENSELAEEAGLRIAGSDDGGQPTDLAVALVMTPRQQDQVIEQEGARVFLDPTAANLLEDKVLDATVDDDGKVRFLMTAPPEGN